MEKKKNTPVHGLDTAVKAVQLVLKRLKMWEVSENIFWSAQ